MNYFTSFFIIVVSCILLMNVDGDLTVKNVNIPAISLNKQTKYSCFPNDYEAISSKVKQDKLARHFLITTFNPSESDGSIEHEDLTERMLSESSEYDFEHKHSLLSFSPIVASHAIPVLPHERYISFIIEFYQPPQPLVA